MATCQPFNGWLFQTRVRLWESSHTDPGVVSNYVQVYFFSRNNYKCPFKPTKQYPKSKREYRRLYILATVEGYEFNPIPDFGLSEENGREEKRIRGKEKYRPKWKVFHQI